MSAEVSTAVDLSELALLPPARFTADQYVQMIQAGVFDDGQRVELIHGIITPKAPAGPDHNSSLIRFTRLFAPVTDRFDVLIQGTVRLGDRHVFDPDFALLRLDPRHYRDRHPTGDDIRLIIESAASSLKKDQEKKLPVYATAGIKEYWILDLDHELLHVHRDPDAAGYRNSQVLRSGDSISPLACPELTIAVADLFR